MNANPELEPHSMSLPAGGSESPAPAGHPTDAITAGAFVQLTFPHHTS